MVRPRLRDTVVGAGGFMLGAIVAFFGLGPALFADGPMSERLVVLAISFAVYFVLGAALGATAPGAWKIAAICLVVPLLPVAALYSDGALSSLPTTFLLVAFLLGDTACALAGSLTGARLRSRRAA